MKTLEQMTKGNALVAVKNVGENVKVVVTDIKNIGKVVAQFAFDGIYNVESPNLEGLKVVDVKSSIYRKISKIVKSATEAVEFKADDEALKKLSEVLADENNLYDLNAILAGTDLEKRTIFVVAKDGSFGLAKTTVGRKTATADKLKEAGYEVKTRFDVDNQIAFINVVISLDELNVTPVSEEDANYVMWLVPVKEEEKPEAETEATAEEQAGK